jgi:hypothetical protein
MGGEDGEAENRSGTSRGRVRGRGLGRAMQRLTPLDAIG